MTARLHRMTITEHHAHAAVGSTALREFRRSPLTYYRRYVERTLADDSDSAARAFGQQFHVYALEPDVFTKQYAVMPLDCDGDGRTTAVKEARREFASTLNGREGIKRADYFRIERMADSLMGNKVARQLMEAKGSNEQSIIWQHASGVECKARFDRLLDSLVAFDLKTSADPSVWSWVKQARSFEYAHQSALYLDGREAVFGERGARFLHVVVGTEEPHECFVYEIDDHSLTEAWREVNHSLMQLEKCRASGDWRGPYADCITTIRLYS